MLKLIDIKHEIDRHIKRIDAILPNIHLYKRKILMILKKL